MNISTMFKIAAGITAVATGAYLGWKARGLFNETESHAKEMADMWNEALKESVGEMSDIAKEMDEMNAQFNAFMKEQPDADAAEQWAFLRKQSGDLSSQIGEPSETVKRFKQRQAIIAKIRKERCCIKDTDNVVNVDFTKKNGAK